MRIESLTEAQNARFPEFIDKWTNIGLDTTPTDRPRAEAAIRRMYEVVGKKAPRIVWCGSPLAQGLTRAILTNPKFWEGLKIKPQDPGASVGDSVWASVWASVRASVRASVGDSVGDSVWDSVWASVGDSVWASVWASVGASVNESCYGQHDANWLAFYDYFREVCGLVAETEKLDGLWELAKSGGWVLPHENICWASERPTVLNLDDQGLLHCENGPALAYPDGWMIFAIHGVRPIPEYVIMEPEKITIEKIDAESNGEIRRIMIERMGHAKYLADTGAKEIHSDEIPIRGGVKGTILRALIQDKHGAKFLCGHDGSTERIYFMSVDPAAKTCSEAHESISGFKEHLIIANA